MIGTKLGHYEITSHLGTGGMGEVYQATDSKLGRSVAIKLLPEAFTHDADRTARFEREARVLASLNHPNIAAIYGVEESGGRKFLVMELVSGETLAEKIKRGVIPLEEALGIALQITEALEAAHEKGVVHRDLKPGNVMLTSDGRVKVLDFGLAKGYDTNLSVATLSNSPTVASIAGRYAASAPAAEL
jgi:serine/threonine-protein kinase